MQYETQRAGANEDVKAPLAISLRPNRRHRNVAMNERQRPMRIPAQSGGLPQSIDFEEQNGKLQARQERECRDPTNTSAHAYLAGKIGRLGRVGDSQSYPQQSTRGGSAFPMSSEEFLAGYSKS